MFVLVLYSVVFLFFIVLEILWSSNLQKLYKLNILLFEITNSLSSL